MPHGYGKTFVSVDKVVDRRSFAHSRRSSPQSIRRFPSKECQMTVPVLRNSEERRIVLTFLTLDDHMWRLLVPFTSFIQGSELRNEQCSQDSVNTDTLSNFNSSYPQQAIFFQFDLKEQSSQENHAYRSFASNVVGKSNRLKRNKFIKDDPSNSLGILAPEESRLSYGSECIALDASVDVIREVDKPLKHSSKSKGKKKRKQCKKSVKKKTLTKPENQGEDVKCDALESETSVNSSPFCSAATGSSLSLDVDCSIVPVQDASIDVLEQHDIESNGKDYSGRLSSTEGELSDKNIKFSRKPPSLPCKFTDNMNNVSIDVASISNKPHETSLSTSFQNNAEIDVSEDSLDDCGTRRPITEDGEFDPMANRMTLSSSDVSVQGENKYSCQDSNSSSSCSVSCSHWKNDVIDIDCSTERLLDSSQASSSDDFRPVIRAKRGRLARKLCESSNGMHRLDNSHLYRCSEKDNRHSFWQKVEKPRTAVSTYKKNNDKIPARAVDISLNCMETKVKSKQLTELKQSMNGRSFSTIDGSSTCNYLEKVHRRPIIDADQETQSALRNSIDSSNATSKNEVVRNTELGAAAEFTKVSQLTVSTNSLRKTMNSQSSISQQASIDDNTCNVLLDTPFPREPPPNSSEVKLNSDLSCMVTQFHGDIVASVDMNTDPYICTRNEGNQQMRIDIESVHPESSNTGNNFEPLLEKCHSPPRYELVITGSQTVNPEDSIVHEQVPSSLISNITGKFLTSDSYGFGSLCARETPCLSIASGCMDCSSYEEDELTRKLDTQPFSSSAGSCDFPSPCGCQFTNEMGNQHFAYLGADLTKISEAVDGSYKLLVAAEDIQRATGTPLAEFEKVLHFASPLIETCCMNMCTTCSNNQITRESLSSHQAPNVLLKNLWQWYEKPGSYGLEVKVDDLYTSNRSRAGISKFCAYFVPYLSAVQLFARRGKSACHPNNDTEGDLIETPEVCKTSKSITSLTSLPIFSKLLPQPHKNADTGLAKLSLLGKSDELNKSFCSEQLADELLIEYFDSDQPQQRRPLFDKIQELIRGDSLSNFHFSGDPSKLGSLSMKELHPASWYAVAWYPIYRIPDGSFRAAFLTYHSFGSIVSRSTPSTTEGCINSLFLPVVGLQSYNAKGECWFEPKTSSFEAAHTDAASSEVPSEILKGRLQCLERTACVMSRATIRKGNQESTNRHPDYEFFLSRSR